MDRGGSIQGVICTHIPMYYSVEKDFSRSQNKSPSTSLTPTFPSSTKLLSPHTSQSLYHLYHLYTTPLLTSKSRVHAHPPNPSAASLGEGEVVDIFLEMFRLVNFKTLCRVFRSYCRDKWNLSARTNAQATRNPSGNELRGILIDAPETKSNLTFHRNLDHLRICLKLGHVYLLYLIITLYFKKVALYFKKSVFFSGRGWGSHSSIGGIVSGSQGATPFSHQ